MRLNSSHSFFVEFSVTWQQCILERVKLPRQCQKQDSVYYTGENELPRSVGVFPGFYCPPTQWSPASAIARSSCLAAEAEFPGKCYS